MRARQHPDRPGIERDQLSAHARRFGGREPVRHRARMAAGRAWRFAGQRDGRARPPGRLQRGVSGPCGTVRAWPSSPPGSWNPLAGTTPLGLDQREGDVRTMCQLLGMNCNTPTDVTFSFTGFAQRGGRTDHHGDGWGIAFFEGRGVRHFVDHQSACDSPIANLIARYPIKVATSSPTSARPPRARWRWKTATFVRELWGRYWVFAHNGNLENFHPRLRQLSPGGRHRQRARVLLGDAGAGQVACRRAQRGRTHADPARTGATHRARHGTFNFLLSNAGGRYGPTHPPTCAMWCASAVCHRHAQRRRRERELRRARRRARQGGRGGDRTADQQRTWTVLAPGELLVFVDGAPVIDLSARALTPDLIAARGRCIGGIRPF